MIEFIAWVFCLPLVFLFAWTLCSRSWVKVIESIKPVQIARIEGKKKQVDIAQISEIMKIIKDLIFGRIERW